MGERYVPAGPTYEICIDDVKLNEDKGEYNFAIDETDEFPYVEILPKYLDTLEEGTYNIKIVRGSYLIIEEELKIVKEDYVKKIYNEFVVLQQTLNNDKIDDLKISVENMEEDIDVFNNFSEEQLDELAVLLGLENGEEAYNIVLSDWIDANTILSIYSVYKDYIEASDEETARAFVEMIDEYDQMYEDRTLIKKFFSNIDNDYKSAKELLKPESDKVINLFEEYENQEFVIGNDKDLTFILDTEDRVFGKVFVNDKELSEENGDYKWGFLEGTYPSAILSEDYMKTLKAGTYKIKIVVEDGSEAETTFTIKENVNNSTQPSIENNNNNNSSPVSNVNGKKDETPKTGTKNIDGCIALIALFSCIGLIVLSKKEI